MLLLIDVIINVPITIKLNSVTEAVNALSVFVCFISKLFYILNFPLLLTAFPFSEPFLRRSRFND